MKSISRVALLAAGLAVLTSSLAMAGPFFTGLKVYVGQKNWPKAVKVGPRAVEEDSDKPEVYRLYGESLAEMDSLEHAGQVFTKGLEVARKTGEPKDTTELIDAQNFYFVREFNASVVVLRDAMDLVDSLGEKADPKDPKVKAVLDKAQEAFAKAERSAGRALLLNPTNEKVWNQKGVALARQHKLDEAIQCYRKALEINPKYDAALGNLKGQMVVKAEKFKMAANWEEASQVFENLVSMGDTSSMQDLGDIYFSWAKTVTDPAKKAGMLKKAAAFYGYLSERNPTDTIAEFNYAVALLNANDFTLAEPVVKHIVARNPMSLEKRSLLINVLALKKDQPALNAESVYRTAREKGAEIQPAVLKPLAGSAAAKSLASLGRPDRVFGYTESGVQAAVWFYLSKGEMYAFVADGQVGKSSWSCP